MPGFLPLLCLAPSAPGFTDSPSCQSHMVAPPPDPDLLVMIDIQHNIHPTAPFHPLVPTGKSGQYYNAISTTSMA